MKKIILIILLLSVGICSLFFNVSTPVYAASTSAKSMATIEMESGRVLYQKNKDQKLAMASTTKIVTALTVLKNCKNLDKKYKIPDQAIGVIGTSIYLKKGEELTIRELLYGMMLPSGNDASTALAIIIGGNETNFCGMMQQTAQSIGAKNSAFANAHGLDAKNHYTTAYDLALITAEALKNPIFEEIVNTKNIKISGTTPGTFRYLRNKNKLLHSLEGCNGVKTGFTDDAGRCFVASAKRDGMTVVSVVFNCGPMFEDCAAIINEAFSTYKRYELLPAYNSLAKVGVENGKKDSTNVYTINGFSYPLTEKEYSEINFVYDIPTSMIAPISKETIIGKYEIYLGSKLLFSTPVLTMEEIKSIDFIFNLKEIANQWTK